ncbi:MAG: hypothetical protein AB8H80_14860, partial [Planctomycetota bacterium]
MEGHANSKLGFGGWLVFLASGAAAVFGALSLEFWCDDAFIIFRYVANAHDGYGLVWNRPPFAPVEGYTSLSWALLLWASWSWFGVEPPDACNWISIGCGVATVALLLATLRRVVDRRGTPAHLALVALALLCVVGNRTFLQWLSSGLETALFQLLFVAWIVQAFRIGRTDQPPRRATRDLACWSLLAAVATWTRPDGLLLSAATASCAAGIWLLDRVATQNDAARTPTSPLRLRTLLLGLAPLLLVVGQIAWRRAYYGEWLPNTYYAKVTTAWPEAGMRYLFCFAAENGTWLLLPLLACSLLVAAYRQLRAADARPAARLAQKLPTIAAIGALMLHAAYYLVMVGGDHFGFRILCHWVPLTALGVVAMSLRLGGSRLAAFSLVALALASSVGWFVFAATDARHPPDYDPLADHCPSWAQPAARLYDRHRLWLRMHMICIRFRTDMPLSHLLTLRPERVRREFPADDIPVAVASAVGLTGWALPDVAIVDELGLNDWVTARTPVANAAAKLLPAELLEPLLLQADRNQDGIWTAAELTAAFAVVAPARLAQAKQLAKLMLVLF